MVASKPLDSQSFVSARSEWCSSLVQLVYDTVRAALFFSGLRELDLLKLRAQEAQRTD